MMSTLTRLKEMNWSATEKRIADFILKHADHLPETTISTIAAECDTSKSMVVQLCKELGFRGYKELCSQLLVEQALNRQKKRKSDAYDDLYPGRTAAHIAQTIIKQEMQCLQETMELIDPEALEEAVRLIRQADKIHLFGVGESRVAALDLHNKLGRIGFNSRFSDDVHCQLLETTSLTEESVALIFSFSGRTRDMIEAAELCRDMGAKVITITRFGDNPVAELGHVCLNAASVEGEHRVTAMSSRMSTMSLVDVLFACLISDLHEQITPQVSRNTDIANRRRK